LVTDGADKGHPFPVDQRLNLRLEVCTVLHNTCDYQGDPRMVSSDNGLFRTLVWMDATKEQQVVPSLRTSGKRGHIDAVVDGGRVLQRRMSIGIAYRHVV